MSGYDASEWKPGDAVVATVNGRRGVRLIAGWSKYEPQLRWGELSTRWADGDDDECWFMPSQVTDHRPLVVIDPEDVEQVADFATIYERWQDRVPYEDAREDGDLTYASAAQAALREFARPTPRIEEPTLIGAIVADRDEELWVRHRDGSWSCLHSPRGTDRDRSWDSIRDQYGPLVILSPGVEVAS